MAARGVRRRWIAVTIGAIATLVVVIGGSMSHRSGTAIDATTRDAWVPALAPVSPAVVVIARDAASETRFGAGTWDRAIVARLVAAVAQAGAAAIGVDIVPGRPGVPGRGGAASDALLAQAIAGAGNVVLMAEPGVPLSPPGAAAPAIGHTVVVTDPDGVVRR